MLQTGGNRIGPRGKASGVYIPNMVNIFFLPAKPRMAAFQVYAFFRKTGPHRQEAMPVAGIRNRL